MEAVFPPENFRIFSDDFRPTSRRKAQKIGLNPPEKSLKIPIGILLPIPAISGAFLQNPVTFPLVSRMFRWDPVAGMFDLGQSVFINLVLI
jgi:hypothetical protein